MSYVNSVLGKDEKVFYIAQVTLIDFLFRFILGAVIFFGGLVFLFSSSQSAEIAISFIFIMISSVLLISPFIYKHCSELVITDKRIIAKFGFIRRNTIELNLSKIESIKVQQGILGRIFNFGYLEIIGTGGTREPIPGIENPLIFRRKFDEILSLQG